MRAQALRVLARTALALVIGGLFASAPGPAEAVAWRWPHYCFFDRGNVDLKPRCRQIIGEAVASWRREQEGLQYKSDSIDPKDPYAPAYTAHLQVRGYAPDAGSPREADRLSVRRAAAVAAELTRLGMPDDFVTPIGFGDKQPVIPDAPLDPLNRLVHIVFY